MGGVVSRWKASKTDPPSNEEGKQDEAELTRAIGFAWVTLATNDSYSLGALVLAHSLRNVNTAHKLAVMITPGVSPPMKEQLSTVFDVVKMVDVLDSQDEAHLALMKRPELGVTFTKIHCWRLTEFEKCVFLDADTLVIKNCDELFDREELSAAPDVGWPDCFNTGVFVFKPSIETFNNIIKFSLENGSFDGGDQGLLNQYFGDWATKDINKHLPFVYNLTSVAMYSYIPAFKQYGSEVRIVHFIGTEKPWLQQLDPQTRKVSSGPGTQHLAPMLQIWWNIFCDKVHPSMTSSLECDSGMRNDEIEVCVNDNPIEPEPEIIQPLTPYLDKEDSRQNNLPYKNFDVKSTTGELLNITYLEKREKEMKEEEGKEEIEQQAEVVEEIKVEFNQNWDHEGSEMIMERQLERAENEGDNQLEEMNPEEHPTRKEEKSVREEEQPCVQSHEEISEEEKIPQIEPFSYENFFPDETCVQQYLNQNVMTYQPLEHKEKKQDDMIVPEQEHHLPRFLSIAEDDRRQSLNEYYQEDLKSNNCEEKTDSNSGLLNYNCNSENQTQILNKAESFESCHFLQTSPEPVKSKRKSLSLLGSPPPEESSLEKVSFWKSHPNLNDPNKKYPMPKLKPILPKQKTCRRSTGDIRPKITQYTEFHMSYDYPEDIQSDTLGFVERQILKEFAQRVSNAENERLKNLPYILPLGHSDNKKSAKEPIWTNENIVEMDCDLSSCQRQKGNQPMQNMAKKKSNYCFLPVLKPIRPSKNEESKSFTRPSNFLSKERGTKAKVESRKAREKAKAESNVKSHSNPTNVEEILKKLINFSKNYQEYFNEYLREKKEEKKTVLGTVFKDVFAASTKDSPRIQYSKEFEEPLDPPLSPFLNGQLVNKNNEADEVKQDFAVNGFLEEPMQKIRTSEFSARPKSLKNEIIENDSTFDTTVNSRNLKERERTVETIEKHSSLSKEKIVLMEGKDPEMLNGYETNGVSSSSETTAEMSLGTTEFKSHHRMDLSVDQRSRRRSMEEPPRTYASVVKEGNKTFRTNPVKLQVVQPKEKKSRKRQKQSSRAVKENRKDQPQLSKPRIPIPPPPSPEEAEPVEKLSNIFTLLPEESCSNVKLKRAKRKAKGSLSPPIQRRPARKSIQERRVIEPSATIDDSHGDNSGIAGAIARLSIQPRGLTGTPSEPPSSAQEDFIRRQNWEMGTMDYMGRDSFDNIWSKICETIDGKVTKDLNRDGANSAPSLDGIIPQKDDVKSDSEIQPTESPEKMTKQSNVVPPGESDASPGTGTVCREITAKASDIASKASEALEAFGKLFVSGPVAIKSEVIEGEVKPPEAAESREEKKESQQEEAASIEIKKSTEADEEGKPKKGVINKILELVGVGKPETSTAVFYDKENENPNENRGNSVFYDTEIAAGDTSVKEELKPGEEPVEDDSEVLTPSPSLTLRTASATEIVCPTPPPTPMTPQIGIKDDRMLCADDVIKATPPVSDKKFDDIPKGSTTDAIKSEVENIIDEAKKLAEEKLQESKAELQTPAPSSSMALVPRLNDALEVFGKLFVSGPVTIKSEVPEEVQKVPETPKMEKAGVKEPEDAFKPAIPMPGVPEKTGVPNAQNDGDLTTSTETASGGVNQQPEPAKIESAAPHPAEIVAPATPQVSQVEPTEETIAEQPASNIQGAVIPTIPEAAGSIPAESPKGEEPSVPIISESVAVAAEAVIPVLGKASDRSTPDTAEMTSNISAAAESIPAEPPKKEEQSAPIISEALTAVSEAAAAVLTKEPEAAAAPAAAQPAEPVEPAIREITDSLTSVTKPEAPQQAESPASIKGQVEESEVSAAQQRTDPTAPRPAPATPKTEVPPEQTEGPKSSLSESTTIQQSVETTKEAERFENDPKRGSPQSPASIESLSKANEALEAFGKHFVSGPVVLKSEIAEPVTPSKQPECGPVCPTKPESGPSAPKEPESGPVIVSKDSEPTEGHSKASEALEVFGRSFISGPVTVKSEVLEDIKTSGEAETDAVHRIFQSKPEDEPIYSNIEEVEEIKVTSEEDRRKEKPQTSKLTEQILKAIPPELRKPFSDASPNTSPEVAQLLSSAEQQTASILLDKPVTEEEVPMSEEGDTSGPSAPPVPPRRNRSKGRDAPQPPPKKKGKNGKE